MFYNKNYSEIDNNHKAMENKGSFGVKKSDEQSQFFVKYPDYGLKMLREKCRVELRVSGRC